jgi:hypothetical protein
VAQSLDIERFSFAHGGVFLHLRESGRRPNRSAEESVCEIRIAADERDSMMSSIAPVQIRTSLNRFVLSLVRRDRHGHRLRHQGIDHKRMRFK